MKFIKMNKRSDIGMNTTNGACEANCRGGYHQPPDATDLQMVRYYEVKNGRGEVPYSIENPNSNL